MNEPKNEGQGVDLSDLEAGARLEESGAAGPVLDTPDQSGQSVDTVAVLAGVLYPTFGVLAPNWKVTPDECATLAGAYSKVIDKYFPGMSLGVEVEALLVTVAIFSTRAGKPMRVVKAAEDGAAENQR